MCGVCTRLESIQMSQRPIRPIERQRMRPWLENLLNTNSVEGLNWTDEKEKIFEIPWRHGSRHGWSPTKDADLFERWAKHTGRYEMDKPNPKKWKANFRCALNSLADVKEITRGTANKESKCVKVYQFVEAEKPKREGRRPYKRRKISTDSENSSTNSVDNSITSKADTRTYIKNEQPAKFDMDEESVPETNMPLPDSTSLDFIVDQETIKQEQPVEIEVTNFPFKHDEDFDIEIDRGVLPNHMSGYIMIQTCCWNRFTETSESGLETSESDVTSFSRNMPQVSGIMPYLTTSKKRSYDESEDESYELDSQNSSPCRPPENTGL